MKYISVFAIAIMIGSCTSNVSLPPNNTSIETVPSADLKVGGLYLFKNKDSTYRLSKILALDEFAVHTRVYSDTIKTKPDTRFTTDNLQILLGHSPMDKNAFLLAKPEFLKVESVHESELDGYKIYLEAMRN